MSQLAESHNRRERENRTMDNGMMLFGIGLFVCSATLFYWNLKEDLPKRWREWRAGRWYRHCLDLDVEPRIVAKIVHAVMEGNGVVNLTQIALAETRRRFNLPNFEPK